jgi:Rrf2 family nitric oxide-sensitive transcriptional repressor
MEPELALVECQAGHACAIGGMCRLQTILDEAQNALLAVLDKYTLADIASPNSRGLARRLGVELP